MNNHFKRDIKTKQGAYKGWKKESTSEESYVFDVRKYSEKVRTARNQRELDLEIKLKQATRSSLAIEIKRKQKKKGDEIGMLCKLRIWHGFDSQSITKKKKRSKYLSFQIWVMMGRLTGREEDLEKQK